MNFLLVIHCATKKVLELKSDNNNFCSEQEIINFFKSQIALSAKQPFKLYSLHKKMFTFSELPFKGLCMYHMKASSSICNKL